MRKTVNWGSIQYGSKKFKCHFDWFLLSPRSHKKKYWGCGEADEIRSIIKKVLYIKLFSCFVNIFRKTGQWNQIAFFTHLYGKQIFQPQSKQISLRTKLMLIWNCCWTYSRGSLSWPVNVKNQLLEGPWTHIKSNE